ncbi:uncharacterized protein LOC119950753 isoform X2 [Scyliorhinus canicula]|uniref:uncharacterized protein LOC119950753 isoform X2 n=1 Tax=Scyliorhinus canicula TaxID=7830 RepID=UPI0018F2D80D|nr:uncharacterized protein LOC119950753 isoform X2 [Scyliorhinus canicula]
MSQGNMVEQKDASPECKEKANLQILTNPKAPLLTDNKNSLWSLLDDAVFEGYALEVNSVFNKTETSGAAGIEASSLPVQANTAASVAEEGFSSLLHRSEQLDKTDEQGSYPSPQGPVGRAQLPAPETKCSLTLSEPGREESIREENPAASTDGQSHLFIVEIQDPMYLTPVSFDKRAECAATAGHNAVSHPQLKVENEQLIEAVVGDQTEKCILPKVSLKGTEASTSECEYALNVFEGAASEGSELSLSCHIDHHQTSNSKENQCGFLTGTENQRRSENMELLSTCDSDLHPAELNVMPLAATDEQQKTCGKEQEDISTDSVCNLVNKTESIPETVTQSSIQQSSNPGRAEEKLMGLSCDCEKGQIYNQEATTNACEGDLGCHQLHMQNIVFPINPQKTDGLEPKETGFVFSDEQQISTSDSKEKVCDDNVWNLQESTNLAPNDQNTYSDNAPNEPQGCCSDSNQQTRGSEKRENASEETLSTVQIDAEICPLPEISDLPLGPGLDLGQVKEMLLCFQSDQQVCEAEKRDGRSEKVGHGLQTGQESGLLLDRVGLALSSQDPQSMDVKGELNLNSASKQHEFSSGIGVGVCEERVSEEDLGTGSMVLLDKSELTPSSELPHTMSVSEILVLSPEQHLAGNSEAKGNICEGNVYSLHTLHPELPLNSQVPDTVISGETLLSVTDKQQVHNSKNKEKTLEENQCDLQTSLESSTFPGSRELVLNRQNCESREATEEKLSDFSHFTGQSSACTVETLCQKDLSKNQMIKNIITPAAMQLPDGSNCLGAAEVKESFMSVNGEQACSSEKQEKVPEDSMCSPPTMVGSTLLSETVDLPLTPQNVESTGTANGQECLNQGSGHQAAQGEIEDKAIREVCSFPTDWQDTISASVDSLLVPQCTAGTEMKEALLVFSEEQSRTFISEEQQKGNEGDVGSLQQGLDDTVLSTSTALALNPQYATTRGSISKDFAHEHGQLCDSGYKEGLYEKDSDSPQMHARNLRIPETSKLPLNVQNSDTEEHGELLFMGFSNEQQQAGSERAKGKDIEENVQSLQTATLKVIATSTDLPPSPVIPSINRQAEELFGHQERQMGDREQQETVSEDNIYNFPTDTQTGLLQLSPATQNIGSIATGSDQLPLGCDSEQEAAVWELAEVLSKEKVNSFQGDQEDLVSERMKLLPVSQLAAGIGMEDASLTFSNEQQQTSISEEQQKNDEAGGCSLQEGLEDAVQSTSTEPALNPQDSATKENTPKDFGEQLQICDTEFEHGFPELNLEIPLMAVENILPPEAVKLSIGVESPEVEKQNDVMLEFSRQQEHCEIKEQQVFEADEQNLWTGNVSTPEVLNPAESCQNSDATKLQGALIGFDSEHQQVDDKTQQGANGENVCCFLTAMESMENIWTPDTPQDPSASGINEKPLGFIDGKQQQIAAGGVEDNYFEENVSCLQRDEENISHPTTPEYTAQCPDPEALKNRLYYGCDMEPQQTNGNATNIDISAESMSNLRVGMETTLPESITLTQNPSIPQALEDNDMSLAFSEEQHIYTSQKEEKISDACSLKTVVENVTSLNNCIELPAGLENHHIEGAKENPLWFSFENDDGLKQDICVESVHSFQLDMANVLPAELIPTAVAHSQSEVPEALSGFIHEKQQIGINEAKENVCEENICIVSTTEVLKPAESCQNSDATKLKGALIGFGSEHQQVDDKTQQGATGENLCLTPELENGEDCLLAFSSEGDKSQSSNGEPEEKVFEDNVNSLMIGAEGIIPEATILTPMPKDAEGVELKETSLDFENESGRSDQPLGFIDGKQQQIPAGGGEDNYFEENAGCLQMIADVIGPTPGSQSPDATNKTSLAVVSEHPQTGINIMKDNNVFEGNMWSLQTGSEPVLAGTMELTASLQNCDENKGKETPQSFCGDLKQEIIVNNEPKANLPEGNLQVAKASTEDTKLLVGKELSACAGYLDATVLSENVMGFGGEQQMERVGSLQDDSANDLFPETTKLIPGTCIPIADAKDAEKISILSNKQQQMCSSLVKEEEEALSFLQNAVENIIDPDSVKLALTPQHSVTSELMAFSNEQQQICSSGMKTEDYTENHLCTDTTILPFSPSENDTIEFREKLSDFSWNIEHQNWNTEAQDNISEKDMYKSKTEAEISTPLQPDWQIPELENGEDCLLAFSSDGDKSQSSNGEPEEKVFEDNVNSLMIGAEGIIPEATILTPMPKDAEGVELKETSLDFENEQQRTCNTENKEVNSIRTDNENISAQEPMDPLSSPPKCDTEKEEDKLLDFSPDTDQQTYSRETKISIFKEKACSDKMGVENSVLPECVKLLSSSDIATELQETTNRTLSKPQQISFNETKENSSAENVHSLENLIVESNEPSCSPLHSDAIIEEDILKQRYDSEKQQTPDQNGKESVDVNSVVNMEKGMTFGIDPETELPLFTLSVSEAVEINQILATTSESEQQQTYDNLISHRTCGEKLGQEMDFALGNGKFPEEMENDVFSAGGMDYKNHAASQEMQLSKSMTTESKEPSSTSDHLFLLHIGDATESCLRTGAKEQENVMGVLSTGNCAGIDQNSTTKQSFVSDIEYGHESLVAIEPTMQIKPGCSSPITLTDVMEEEALPSTSENTEVRIAERELNKGLKTESPSPESALSSPSAHGEDTMGVICTVSTAALDKASITASVSLASEKKGSVPPLPIKRVAPDPPQHSEHVKPLDDVEVLQNHLEQPPLSVSLASEKKGSVPPLPIKRVAPDPPQHSEHVKPLDDVDVLQNHLEQPPLSVSLASGKTGSVPPLLLNPVVPVPPQHSEHIKPLVDVEVLQNHPEQTPLSVSLASGKTGSVPPLLLNPVVPDPPQHSEHVKPLDPVEVLQNHHLEQTPLSVSLATEQNSSVPPLLLKPIALDPPQHSEHVKPLDDVEDLQNHLEQTPVSVSLASEQKGSVPSLLLEPIAPDSPQHSKHVKPLDDADILQNHLEQTPLSVPSPCENQDLHPLFVVTPHIVPIEAIHSSSEQITKSTAVPCDIKDTDSSALLVDFPSLPKGDAPLQDEQSTLSSPVPCDCGEQVDPFLPPANFTSPLQSNGTDEASFDTAHLLKELYNTVYGDNAESIPPSPSLCSDAGIADVEHVSISVFVPSDCEEPAPALPLPLPLPTLRSDDTDKPTTDITDQQKELVSDSEEPIVLPLPSVPPPLLLEGSSEPKVDTTDLQGRERSSDSEGAFETPEETTPVKVPPQISPAAAEKESQEQPPSEQSVFFPDDIQTTVDTENELQETDSFRPLTESASIVFDEDKPIASSGAYKIDFDSLDVLDSFQPHSDLDPSSPVKSEGSKLCGQADENSLHTTSSGSPAPPQSPPLAQKSDGTTDVGLTEETAKPLQAEAFSIASDNTHSLKKKKPRPLSFKRKTKSEKPAETTQADKPTETPTVTETQARLTVPETNNEVTISQLSCDSLQGAVGQQDSPIPHQASCSFDPDNLTERNPFAGGGKQQTLPVAQSECETHTAVLKESDKTVPESATLSDTPAVGQAVRLEFDYSEDKDSFEAEQGRKPVPKKFGKRSGGKMPLRKPKIGIKKVPTVEKVDNALTVPSHSTVNPDDIPIPKTTYSFDPSKWDDPNFDPFNTNIQVPNSPKLTRASFSFDTDNCDNSVDPFKSSTKISGSPSHSPASFEVNDDTGTSEGDANNKSSKKKRLPLKTNTFRVKRSPKRTSVSEASSQESTPLTTPETPKVIGTVEHATDEEKLASSVTSQKWSYSGIQSELDEDNPDYPQPSDLSAFVNESSEFVNENYSSAVLGYEHSLEIEYMEKIGSSSPHHDTNAKKQSMYLKIDSLKDSPIKCPPIRLSDSTTPCSGSSLDDADDGVLSTANRLSVTRPLVPSQEAHLQSPDILKDTDSLNSSPTKSDLATPEEPVASADVLLSRIIGHTDDELDYLQPDTAEKDPSAFAYKLQEELVYAAMRIEALKVAKQLSNSPRNSSDNEQRDSTPSMDTPITKSALYSRTGDSEIDDTQADGHHYNQRDLDSALRTAREEIVTQEREAADWKRKYDESRQEVGEMRRIVAEYEKTIAQMIGKPEDDHKEKSMSHHTVQQLIMEKEQALSDLNSVEKSLAELFRRYEKMKEVLEGFRKNEEVLKKCAQEYLARVKKEEQRYHALKIHAEEKLDKANSEIAQVRGKSKSEQVAFQASLRKEQMKVESLERTLEQKNKEVEELTKICDELIAKMGKS